MGDGSPTAADDAAGGAAPAMEPTPVEREPRLRVDRVSPKRTRVLIAYHERLGRFRRRMTVAALLSWVIPGLLIAAFYLFVNPNHGHLAYRYPFFMLLFVIVLSLPMLITAIVYANWPTHLRVSMRGEASRHEFKLCGTCLRDLRGEPRFGHCPDCGAFYGFAVLEAAWRELYHDAAHKFPAEHVGVEPAAPCLSCGYDLRGLDDAERCPECGATIAPDPAAAE